MPLYFYHCENCGGDTKRLFGPQEVPEEVPCRYCGVDAKRNPIPPSTRCVETLDNGIMSRRVERIANAEEVFAEHTRAK